MTSGTQHLRPSGIDPRKMWEEHIELQHRKIEKQTWLKINNEVFDKIHFDLHGIPNLIGK